MTSTVASLAADSSSQKTPSDCGGSRFAPLRERPEILLQALVSVFVATVVLWNLFCYAWDDFLEFSSVQQYGLGKHTLGLSLFRHFAPLNRLVHGIVLNLGGLDPRVGYLVVVLIVGTTSFVLGLLLRRLGTGRVLSVALTAAVTLSPALLFPGSLLDEIVHVGFVVMFSVLAMWSYSCWHQDRRRSSAFLTVTWVFLGCASQERGGMIIVALVAFRVLILEPDFQFKAWWVHKRADLVVLVPSLVVCGLDAVIVRLYYYTPIPFPTPSGVVSFLLNATRRQILPITTGTNGLGGAHAASIGWLVTLATLVLMVGTVVSRPRNIRPWLFVGLMVMVHLLYVAIGIGGLTSFASLEQSVWNYAYILPFFAVALGTLRAGRFSWNPFVSPSSVSLLSVVLAVMVGLSCWYGVAANRLLHDVGGRASSSAYAHSYLVSSSSGLRAVDGNADLSVVPVDIPSRIIPPGWGTQDWGEVVLPLYGLPLPGQFPVGSLRYIAKSGRISTAQSAPEALGQGSGAGLFVRSLPDSGTSLQVSALGACSGVGLSIPITPADGVGGQEYVALRLTQRASPRVAFGAVLNGAKAGFFISLNANENIFVTAVRPGQSSITLQPDPGGRLCLTGIERFRAVVTSGPISARCRGLLLNGTLGQTFDCPKAVRAPTLTAS